MLYKNSRLRSLIFVFTLRLILDALAFLHLILRGKFENAKSVIEAHKDFFKMRPDFKHNRRENLKKRVIGHIPTKFRGSILWNYYVKGKKTYAAIFK